MKLCVDPESRSAVRGTVPTVRRSCIVSPVRMPVMALREMNGSSMAAAGGSSMRFGTSST
jgi:hypothetical protein